MKRSASSISLNNITPPTNVQEEQNYRQTLNELNQFEQNFNPNIEMYHHANGGAPQMIDMEQSNDFNLLLASLSAGVYNPAAAASQAMRFHPHVNTFLTEGNQVASRVHSNAVPQQTIYPTGTSDAMIMQQRFGSPTELFDSDYQHTSHQNQFGLYDPHRAMSSDAQESFVAFNAIPAAAMMTNGTSTTMANSVYNSKSITSLQVWSEFISENNGVPIVEVNEDQIPSTIVGGKSVTKRRRTPLMTSMTVDVNKLRQWVEVLIAMVTHKNPIMEHAESFLNVCAMHHLFIDLEELKSKVETGETSMFQETKWFSEVVLLVNDTEQENGLESDGSTTNGRGENKNTKKRGKTKKKNDEIKHAYVIKESTAASHHRHVEFVPLRAKVVSSNKKNCKLRYKLLYDSWLVFQVDSGNTFAINCGKTSKKERKKKTPTEEDATVATTPTGLSRVSSFGNLSYTSTTSDELRQDQELFNEEDLAELNQRESYFSISPSSGSLNGGYLVFIQVKRSKVVIDGSPEQSVILFGDRRAEIQQIDQNAFFVKAPPGEGEGKVPVKIHSGNITLSDNDLYFEYTPAVMLSDNNQNKRKSYDNFILDEERPNKKPKSDDGFTPPASLPGNMSIIKADEENRIVYRREWAIIIGVNSYESKALLSTQKQSIHDATNLSNVLAKDYGFNVVTLYNEQATRHNILKLFDSISENVHKEDGVLIYFVGLSIFKKYSNNHTEGFIAPYDADPDNITNTGISHESFVNSFKCFPAKHVCYILDTCYTGRLFKIRTTQDDTQYFKTLPTYSRNRAAQIICASSEVTDIQQVANGLFTKHLINALTTMRYKTKSHIWSNNTQFSTADQLGQFIQERVIKETNGKQIPKFGRIEIGDGQFMFITKASSEKSPNPEIERIISLVCVYEEYLQNMNLGDIHTKENLLQLMKIKFFQSSKFFLDALANLLTKQTLELRSDFYAFMRLSLPELQNTAKHSYLAVYSPVPDWMVFRKYQLADTNAQLLKSNPHAIVKRIFIVERKYQNDKEMLEYLKLMRYHKKAGIDVRVVFSEDIESRKDLPRNFAIIDSRLCQVLYMVNEYPKSVLIFNRKTIADIYYSNWVFIHNLSISYDEYATKYHPDLASNLIEPPAITTSTAVSITNDPAKMMSLTDPLLAFDSEENVKSVQHHLNPMLSGFKNVLSSLVSVTLPSDSLSDGCKQILMEKFQKISKCYEQLLTTFFSEGKLEVNSHFFDRHRVRLHDLENTVEKCYRGCIPVHSWLPYQSSDSESSPYFTFESVNEIAEMNKRLFEKRSDLSIERVFVFHRQMFTATIDSTENFNVNLHIDKILETLNAHEESKVKVFVVILDSLDEVKKIPGTFCIIDNCLIGGTEMRTEQVPLRFGSSADTRTETNVYYVNKISANPNDVQMKLLLWNELFKQAMSFSDFKIFIQKQVV
jgi:hypothetical protein